MTTLGELVAETVSDLNQHANVRGQFATFDGWSLDAGGVIDGVKLKDSRQKIVDSYVELDSGEVVYVSNHSTTDNSTVVPGWFRAQLGTSSVDAVTEGTRVNINPLWTRVAVAKKLVDGIQALYPDLFGVGEVVLSSTVFNGNYELPADVDGVMNVTLETFGPARQEIPLQQWSFDSLHEDGKKYLRVQPIMLGGRPLRVTYRKQPVVPEPNDFGFDWPDTGLPLSASDLPVKYAISALLPSTDAARAQSQSIAQSDSTRFVQMGSLNSVSRRYEEMFRLRLRDEQRKLQDRFPARCRKVLNSG